MSACSVTPEASAARRYLETDNEELQEREEAEMVRGEEELGLLLTDLEASPTVAKLELYLKRLFELQCFTQRSLARKLERYQYEDVCLADLEERPGAFLCFGTEEEVQRHTEGLATQGEEKDAELARLVAQVEEGQRSHAENVHRLDVVNGLIAKRRTREQESEFESEDEGYEYEREEHENEYAAHDASKVLRRKLAI